MTNLQLLLTIGIPSFLVVLSWVSNNTRFSEIDRRFSEVDKRLDNMDKRFAEIDKRFNEVIMAQHKDALEIMRNMTWVPHFRDSFIVAKVGIAR